MALHELDQSNYSKNKKIDNPMRRLKKFIF